MNTSKVELDEILQISRPGGVKTRLRYVVEKSTKRAENELSNMEGVFKKGKLSSAERKRMKSKRSNICRYCIFIGHIWNGRYQQTRDLR